MDNTDTTKGDLEDEPSKSSPDFEVDQNQNDGKQIEEKPKRITMKKSGAHEAEKNNVNTHSSKVETVNNDVAHLNSDSDLEENEENLGQDLEQRLVEMVLHNNNEEQEEAVIGENELEDRHDDNIVEARLQDNDLQMFQEHWLREIGYPRRNRQADVDVNLHIELQTDEEKAEVLYIRGKELEMEGNVAEALKCFKEAVLLFPEGESKYCQYTIDRQDSYGNQEEESEEPLEPDKCDDDSNEDEVLADGQMLNRLQRILAKKGRLLEPAQPQKEVHLSWLPYELVLQIFRWVVGSNLDVNSLEKASACCRGFYVAARDQDIWKSLCARTWRFNCGTPKSLGYDSWRDMYMKRPHLRLHGCYISKTTYIRHGENSFQDTFYRPWYNVEYYRYLRFFPDGQVFAWTTAEVPSNAVSLLHHRYVKHNIGILSGYYRLVGDKVIIVVKKQSSEKKPAQATNTRFRARIKDTHDYQQQVYQMELELQDVKSRRNFQLSWLEYRLCRRGVWTDMEVAYNKYPPFYFSRVKHYTAESCAPLA